MEIRTASVFILNAFSAEKITGHTEILRKLRAETHLALGSIQRALSEGIKATPTLIQRYGKALGTAERN